MPASRHASTSNRFDVMTRSFGIISKFSPRDFPGALFLAVALCAVPPLPVNAQQSDGGGSQQAGVQSPAGVVNTITQTAVQLGALTCAARIQQVTSFLGATSETRASLRRPQSPPDRNSFSVSMAIPVEGETGLAIAEFFPVGNACKATYSLTVNLAGSCGDIRASRFASMTEQGRLSDNISELVGPNSLRVLLIDAFDGCTVIKTETLD